MFSCSVGGSCRTGLSAVNAIRRHLNSIPWRGGAALLFLSLICATGPAGASVRQTPVDSLVNQIGPARYSTLESLFGMLATELRKLPPDQIKQQEEKILDACDDDPRKRVLAYRALSWAMETNAAPQALQYLYDAAAYARRADTMALSHALLNLGAFLQERSSYTDAIGAFLEVYDISEKIHNDSLRLEALRRMLPAYYGTANHEEVQNSAPELTQLFQQLGAEYLGPSPDANRRRGIINAFNAAGLSYQQQGGYDSAIHYFTIAMRVARQTGDEEWIGILSGNEAIVFTRQGRYKEALKGLLTDIRVSSRHEIWESARNGCVSLSDLYLLQHDVPNAVLYLDSALYYNEVAKGALPVTYWRVRSNVEAAQGKFREALESQRNYAEKSTDQLKQLQVEQVTRMRSAYEMVRSQKEIELLTRENEAKESYIAFQRTLFTAAIIVLLLVLVLTAHFVISYRRQKKNAMLIARQRDEIEEKNTQLQLQNSEIGAQNEELLQQQEEIAAQRDTLESQNVKLRKAQETIAQHNKEIQTENERLEEIVNVRTHELRRSNQELTEYNDQLKQFGFITAHNLRSPVARILGLGNLLQLSQDGEDSKTIIEKIVHSTKELDAVVCDLGKILEVRENNDLEYESVDLSHALDRTCKALEKEFTDANAQLHQDFAAGHSVHAVSPYVESIVYNLISNAIKYRSVSRDLIIHVSTRVEGNYLCLVVRDNGQGIDLNKHGDNIFNLYKRFHFNVEGKGLGLYLVKSQVTAMGGKVELVSTPHAGSSFFVYFKQIDEHEATS